MPKFPEPPPAEWLKANVPADVHLLHAGSRCWRIYFHGRPYPTLWSHFRNIGPSRARFDHHLPPRCQQERAVLYASVEDGRACFAEVFQDTRVIDRHRHTPWLVAFELVEPLELLDLTGAWPTQAGASMAINSGPRPRAQRWARAIYDAYPTLHGIRYASSMLANQPLVALFERASHSIPTQPSFNRALSDPLLGDAIANAALKCNYKIV